jgi:hypothetical protein
MRKRVMIDAFVEVRDLAASLVVMRAAREGSINTRVVMVTMQWRPNLVDKHQQHHHPLERQPAPRRNATLRGAVVTMSVGLHGSQISKVLGDVFQLIQKVLRIMVPASRIDDAVLHMLMNQGLLSRRDRSLNSVQLLGDFDTRRTRLHHAYDILQVATRSLEPVDNLRVTLMRM